MQLAGEKRTILLLPRAVATMPLVHLTWVGVTTSEPSEIEMSMLWMRSTPQAGSSSCTPKGNSMSSIMITYAKP